MSIKDKYSVQSIKPSETYEWLLYKHYLQRIPPISYAFGLYKDYNLIGICTFGVPASPSLCTGVCGTEYKDIVFELNRLCINENIDNNSLSHFLSKSLKLLPKTKIIVTGQQSGAVLEFNITVTYNQTYTG